MTTTHTLREHLQRASPEVTFDTFNRGNDKDKRSDIVGTTCFTHDVVNAVHSGKWGEGG